MIKLVFCLRRLPTLSKSKFHRYWADNHAELVRQHARHFEFAATPKATRSPTFAFRR
jgi:hypothetical protein